MSQTPETLPAVSYSQQKSVINTNPPYTRPQVERKLVGVDVFCEHIGATAKVAKGMQACDGDRLKLRMISSRGITVWPEGFAQTLLCDH